MNRRTSEPTTDAQSQFLTIYCSLILLLLVFFIMLLSYSTPDAERFDTLRNLTREVPKIPKMSIETRQAIFSLGTLARRKGMEADLALIEIPGGFKAILPEGLLFRSGDASLGESAWDLLDGIAEMAREREWSIRVEGHTDDRPIETERFPSNWDLSATRAVNVLRYLQDRGRIPSYRLAAVGYGKYRPRADNGTAEGRQLNRRIELLIRTGT